MDGAQEFPHVASSPGEMSPGEASKQQAQQEQSGAVPGPGEPSGKEPSAGAPQESGEATRSSPVTQLKESDPDTENLDIPGESSSETQSKESNPVTGSSDKPAHSSPETQAKESDPVTENPDVPSKSSPETQFKESNAVTESPDVPPQSETQAKESDAITESPDVPPQSSETQSKESDPVTESSVVKTVEGEHLEESQRMEVQVDKSEDLLHEGKGEDIVKEKEESLPSKQKEKEGEEDTTAQSSGVQLEQSGEGSGDKVETLTEINQQKYTASEAEKSDKCEEMDIKDGDDDVAVVDQEAKKDILNEGAHIVQEGAVLDEKVEKDDPTAQDAKTIEDKGETEMEQVSETGKESVDNKVEELSSRSPKDLEVIGKDVSQEETSQVTVEENVSTSHESSRDASSVSNETKVQDGCDTSAISSEKPSASAVSDTKAANLVDDPITKGLVSESNTDENAASDIAETGTDQKQTADNNTEPNVQVGIEETQELMDTETEENKDGDSSGAETPNVERKTDSSQNAESNTDEVEDMEVDEQAKDVVPSEDGNVQSTDSSSNKQNQSVETKDDNAKCVESDEVVSRVAESTENESSSSLAEDGKESAQISESGASDSKITQDENDDSQMSERESESVPVSRSDTADTEDSAIDQSTKDGKDTAMEQFLKPPVKVFDECSMESFVSAKSSEFDYGDSLQGSPLPVKRVRELIDESPRASPVPSKRSRASSPASHDTDAATRSDDDLGQFPAENVFEYQWPQESGEWYFVQEQISEFLGVKSFKRKYPELERRVMDIKEKDFLRERGVVTEEQVTLGLTALRGEEVYDLMMKDYTSRYREYARVIQEKQRQTISNQHTGYKAPTVDASKIKEYLKKAARQAAEFNAALMREKREERRYYFDIQTMQLHLPQSKMKKLSKEDTNIGAYPVAVIPGQYVDYCKGYESDELKYLPLNTAIYGPMAVRRKTDFGPDVEDPEVDDDMDSFELTDLDDMIPNGDKPPSTTPSKKSNHQQAQQQQQQLQQQQHQMQLLQQQQEQEKQQQQRRQHERKQQPPPPPAVPVPTPSSVPPPSMVQSLPLLVAPGPASSGSDSDIVRLPGPEALQMSMEAVVPAAQTYQPKVKPKAICGLCLKDRHANTKGVAEELVHCSQCDNSGHPSCLEMTVELVATIKTYPWQCMECKTCSQCGDPTHEDKMMFCDRCDRGYHTFCVGLTEIPTGNWMCPGCTSGGGIPPPLTALPLNPILPVPQPALPPLPLPPQAQPLPPQAQPLPPQFQQQGLQPLSEPSQLQQPQPVMPPQQQLLPPPSPQQVPQPVPQQQYTPQPAGSNQEATIGSKRKSSKR